MTDLDRYKAKLTRLLKHKEEEPNNTYHDWDMEIQRCKCNIAEEVMEENKPLTLDELRGMEGEPIWIDVLDRPDLSRWHFIVRTESLGLIAKDGLGQYECNPHNEKQITFSGCYFDIEHGHNYGINWLACRNRPVR